LYASKGPQLAVFNFSVQGMVLCPGFIVNNLWTSKQLFKTVIQLATNFRTEIVFVAMSSDLSNSIMSVDPGNEADYDINWVILWLII